MYTWGGLRTFILIAMTGAICAWLSLEFNAIALFVAGALGVCGLLISSYFVTNRKKRDSTGLTTEFSAIIVYLLGGAAAGGHPETAVILAICTSAVLTFKQSLHKLTDQIDQEDLSAGLKLLFATFIVLPLIPDTTVDPWGAINPYKLWWVVILVSGLSLVGYGAVRSLGESRGLALTGLFGGLVSSTAATLSFSRQSKDGTGGPNALAMGILLAWGVMFIRVMVLVAVLNIALLPRIAPAMVAMAVCCVLTTGWFWRETQKTQEVEGKADVDLRNPFALTEAIKFALFLAAVLLAVEISRTQVSEEWLYVIAALAGSTDADAVALSMAQADLTAIVAVRAIVIAAVANTLLKAGMVAALGTPALAKRVGIATAVVVTGGVLAVIVPGMLNPLPSTGADNVETVSVGGLIP